MRPTLALISVKPLEYTGLRVHSARTSLTIGTHSTR
jgi:hypothetical protein